MNKLRGSSKTNVMKKINQKASDGANDGELKLVSSSANLNKSERRKRLVNTKAKISHFDSELQDNAILSRAINGELVINLIGAQNLANTDTIGVSDPYCILTASFMPSLRLKTRVVENSLNPRWNESFKFEASLKNARGDFYIHLWDYDLIGSDDWLGMVRIPLYSVVENPGVGVHAWLPLDMETKEKAKGSEQGKVFVKMVYNPKKKPETERPARPPITFTVEETAKKTQPKGFLGHLSTAYNSVIAEVIEEFGAETPHSPDKKDLDKISPKKSSKSGSKSSKKKDKPQKTIATEEDEEGVSDVVASNQGNLTKIETREQVEADYKFGKKLGEGATAIVKLARSTKDNKKVAIKIVNKESDDWDEENIAAFRTEVHILGIVSECSHLISSIDLRETQQHIYIAMELICGGELFDAIMDSEEGFFEGELATRCIWNILKGIEFLHNKGIVHRDIKPENVLLTNKDPRKADFKLSDYGASALTTPKSQYVRGFIGTVMYMAPEVISGQKYSKAVDVWSLGVLAYVVCCGFPPYDGDDDGEMMGAILENELDFPSPEWDDVSPLAKAFIITCLASNPKKRTTVANCLAHPWLKALEKENKTVIGA